jgi:hypothetical protein
VTPDYEEIATSWEGQIWRPHFVVSHEDSDDRYWWKDLAADDGWTGPFETEVEAWKDICKTYDLLEGE